MTTMMGDPYALARAGFPVLPLVRGGKAPAISASQGGHGAHDATTDGKRIYAWAQRYPGCNWGIATGPISGLLVVDIDVRPGKRGRESMEALVQRFGRLPRTMVVRTGSGGFHYYFVPPHGDIRQGENALAEGVDVKHRGSYVVAPGSVTDEKVIGTPGGPYTVLCDAPIARCPAWMADMLAPRPEPTPAPTQPRRRVVVDVDVLVRARSWLAKMPASVQGENTGGPDFRGTGSCMMYWAAICLVRGYSLSYEAAWPLIKEYNERAVPRWSDRELRHKLRSAQRSSRPDGFLLNAPRRAA